MSLSRDLRVCFIFETAFAGLPRRLPRLGEFFVKQKHGVEMIVHIIVIRIKQLFPSSGLEKVYSQEPTDHSRYRPPYTIRAPAPSSFLEYRDLLVGFAALIDSPEINDKHLVRHKSGIDFVETHRINKLFRSC